MVIKHYSLSNMEEYLQYEQLLGKLAEFKPLASPRWAPFLDYYTGPEPNGANGLYLVWRAGTCNLRSQLEVLGLKREFDIATVWNIVSDITEGVVGLNQRLVLYLGLKPENVVQGEDGGYMLTDLLFNRYTTSSIRRDEEQRLEEQMKQFPQLVAKKEHTLVIFKPEGNEYINTRVCLS